MPVDKNLMPIGRFSKSCRLSIKALRHYDQEGLLMPAYVDQQTGYRYYARQQASEDIMIGMLRSLEIPISKIRVILNGDKTLLKKLLSEEQIRVEKELFRQQKVLHSIQRIARAGDLSPYHIAIRHEPDYWVCQRSCKTIVESMIADSTQLIYALFETLHEAGHSIEHPVMCINEDPDRHEQIVVHACVGVGSPAPKLKDEEITTVSGGPMAWLSHQGSYQELGVAYHALFAWAQERGHDQRAAMREIYLNDPAETPEDELITEVMLPISID